MTRKTTYIPSTFKEHLLVSALGFLLGLLVFFYISYSEAGIESGIPIPIGEVLLTGVVGCGLAYLVYATTRWLDQVLPWQTHTGRRMLSGILIHTFLVLGIVLLCTYVYVGEGIARSDFMAAYAQTLIKLGIIVLIVVVLYSIVYFALYAYHLYAVAQIQQVKVERKHIALRLTALKKQLSPHFLFNSLNTISSLILRNPAQAEQFIRKLAASYQYTLDSYNKRWVTLHEELTFVDDYHFLLKTRFEDHVTLDVDIPTLLRQTLIPPLTLQMLVENAVKHNPPALGQDLQINIGADEKWLWVSNNKTSVPPQVDSFGIGLTNIQARYKIMSNQEIEVQDGTNFLVKLPLIQ